MKITGSIDDWGCPILKCEIGNKITLKSIYVNALIDTGSYKFHLKKGFISLLELENNGTTNISTPIAGVADKYLFECVLIFNDTLIVINVCEMQDTFNYDLIIGSNFFKDGSFTYEGKDKVWNIII